MKFILKNLNQNLKNNYLSDAKVGLGIIVIKVKEKISYISR